MQSYPRSLYLFALERKRAEDTTESGYFESSHDAKMCGTPTSVLKTPRRRLTPEERAERRRKQHRELVARGRARSRELIARLRDEEISLRMSIVSLRAGASDDGPCDARRTHLLAAIGEQLDLEEQNERLEDQIDTHVRFREAIILEARVIDSPEHTSTKQFLADLRWEHDTSGHGCDEFAWFTRWLLGPNFWSLTRDEAPDDHGSNGL